MSSPKQCPTGCDNLSDDLIYDILLRLPVKSLLRCKAVSKPWCCLISSPGFVKSHQTRRGSHAETTFMMHHHELNDDVSVFSLFRLRPSQLVTDLKCPYTDQDYLDSVLVGSDRGIVCVTVKDDWYSLCEARCCTSTYLWNPATMQYKFIPPYPNFYDYGPDVKVSLGFGFDHIDDDFKVVRLMSSQRESQVYSAKMNVWRQIVPMPTDFPCTADDKVCIHGVLCWTDFDGIFTFDLNKEVFTSVTYTFPIDDSYPSITELNGSIAVVTGKITEKINFWTLEDFECLREGGVRVAASWTRIISIDLNVPGNSVPTCYNNDFLLQCSDDGKWFLYEFGKKEAKEVSVSFSWKNCFKYKETLLSIPGFKQVK